MMPLFCDIFRFHIHSIRGFAVSIVHYFRFRLALLLLLLLEAVDLGCVPDALLTVAFGRARWK